LIKIEKVPDGYIARITPPHVQQPFWMNPAPLGAEALIKELRALNLHTTDIADAFHEADPDWQSHS
jgi:hypothetical protein